LLDDIEKRAPELKAVVREIHNMVAEKKINVLMQAINRERWI
jgi:hypothetical protein